MHLAFTVDTRQEVDTFYAAALEAGATPRETPAIHTQYHDDYYGGFVNDPHGINLEAVWLTVAGPIRTRPTSCRQPRSNRTMCSPGPDVGTSSATPWPKRHGVSIESTVSIRPRRHT